MKVLTCHNCGSAGIEAVETTEAFAVWRGVILEDDGVLRPAHEKAVLDYGDTGLRPRLHCLGCDAWWWPKRKWDAMRSPDARTAGA